MFLSSIEESMPFTPSNGNPTEIHDNRLSYEKKRAVYFILASTLFERIAFYSLVTNLVLTLQSSEFLYWNPQHSQIALFIFFGITYLSTLIFAIVSDAILGRAKTIIIGFCLYFIGYTLITVTVDGKTSLCNFNTTNYLNTTSMIDESCAPAILGTLICTAIGAGAVKSNMAVLGAEQIQESKLTSRFFDKYIVAVNIGSVIATLVIPYIQNNSKHYFSGYIIADSVVFIAALLFCIGWRYYIHIQPNETVVRNCIPVIKNAFQTWYKYKQIRIDNKDSSAVNLLNTSYDHYKDDDELVNLIEQPKTFLDFAKAIHGGKYPNRIVDDIKSLRRALIVFTLLIPYWVIYDQRDATFLLQGQHMKYPRDKKYIISWMLLGDPIAIIIGIFILNIFVYKHVNSWTKAAKIITRFVIGMVFAMITMCITGIVEVVRQHYCVINGEDSNLSIYYQLPQNIFLGISELFAMVASYEFAYFTAPLSAQSLFMSLHFCSIGISSFISTAYIYIFPSPTSLLDFICTREKLWSFYVYFFNLAGLQLLCIIIIIICYKKFRIVKVNPQKKGKPMYFRQSSFISMD